jgi:hypothetical protein
MRTRQRKRRRDLAKRDYRKGLDFFSLVNIRVILRNSGYKAGLAKLLNALDTRVLLSMMRACFAVATSSSYVCRRLLSCHIGRRREQYGKQKHMQKQFLSRREL